MKRQTIKTNYMRLKGYKARAIFAIWLFVTFAMNVSSFITFFFSIQFFDDSTSRNKNSLMVK